MKKKELANEYQYSSDPDKDNSLMAVRNGRLYRTKMKAGDLPEWYCDIHRCWYNRDMINTKGVVDIDYEWVKENHFMKDSILRISYTGKIEEVYYMTASGRRSMFPHYVNADVYVFGHEIFKCLAYIGKYSGLDLSVVRSEFVKQCKWLKENEPLFAPHGTDDFGKWFDDRLKEELEDNK